MDLTVHRLAYEIRVDFKLFSICCDQRCSIYTDNVTIAFQLDFLAKGMLFRSVILQTPLNVHLYEVLLHFMVIKTVYTYLS